MQFKPSERTLSVLKNMATINPNLTISSGDRLTTMADTRNIFAEYALEDGELTLDDGVKIGVYDLGEFLSILNMFSAPKVNVDESGKKAVITGEQAGQKVQYFFAAPSILTKIPDQLPNVDSSRADIQLPQSTIQSIQKAGNMLSVPNVTITDRMEDGQIAARVHDVEDNTSNTFELALKVDSCDLEDFSVTFNIANLKLIQGDYQLSILDSGAGYFKGLEGGFGVNYIIAYERKHSVIN